MVREFTIGPGDQGSIQGRVIPKTPPCLTLSIIRYGSRISGANLGKGVAPFSTPRCRGYWKRNFQVALDHGRPTYIYSQSVLYRTNSKYELRHECRNLGENKTMRKYKICVLGKAGQYLTYQFHQWHGFACDIILKREVSNYKEGKIAIGYKSKSYEKIYVGNIFAWAW